MSKGFRFFSYLSEMHAPYKNKTAREILRQWNQHDITQKNYDNYRKYHTEAIENAFDDIDSLLATGEYAW